MKWKLTSSFIISIVLIVTIVIFINSIVILLFFISSSNNMDLFFYNMQNTNYLKPEEYVRDFNENIQINNGQISITENGKKSLDQNKAWIQILDKDSTEIYSYKKEKTVPTKYTPIELIHNYKYANPSSVFVGEKVINGYQYSYLVGFPYQTVGKNVITYNKQQFKTIIGSIFVLLLGIDLIIALIFGLYFSGKLTKPVKVIIEGIGNLYNGDYRTHYDEHGLYKEVYSNMNDLASILQENKIERMNLDRMREEWFANISHDIKTPLASIKGYAELLNSEYDFTNEEIKEYSEIIEQKSIYIKELVDDFNLSARLRNKNIILNLEKCNIVKVIKGVVIDILNIPENSNRNIEFISDTKNIEKKIDVILFKRAINNIIHNAIVHNDENVDVQVKIQNKNDQAHITIKDNGKGISNEELKYIFTRYYRGTNTGKKHEGSGLGMAIARDIIKAHGGDILVESELGKGTTFKILITC